MFVSAFENLMHSQHAAELIFHTYITVESMILFKRPFHA